MVTAQGLCQQERFDMKPAIVFAVACCFAAAPFAGADAPARPTSIYALEVESIDGKTVKLETFNNDVLLIVNVASQCGLTDRNYKKLEPLFRKYKDQGFRILAFPANDFGAQEPGTHAEIKSFCAKYDVSFDLFAKISVKGKKMCPLYKFLTQHADPKIAGPVQWNFQKYLVGRDGKVIAKFSPKVDPDDEKLVTTIEAALAVAPPNTGA